MLFCFDFSIGKIIWFYNSFGITITILVRNFVNVMIPLPVNGYVVSFTCSYLAKTEIDLNWVIFFFRRISYSTTII